MRAGVLALMLAAGFMAGCASPAAPASGHAADGSASDASASPASNAGSGTSAGRTSTLPVKWDGQFGPDVESPAGNAGLGWFAAKALDAPKVQSAKGTLTLTWQAASPTDLQLTATLTPRACSKLDCDATGPEVSFTGASPLALPVDLTADGTTTKDLEVYVTSARTAGVQATVDQTFSLTGSLTLVSLA